MAADVLEFTSHGYNGYVYNADNGVFRLWAIGPTASTISPLIFCMAERNR